MNRYYLYPALWTGIVTFLSVLPGVHLPKFDLFSADKLGHFFVYAVLCVSILYGISGLRRRRVRWGDVAWAVVASAAYGVLMEGVQYAFVPGRMYEFDDMMANAAGAVVGGGGFRIWQNLKKFKDQNAG